ncbi:hypothetical protein BHM03_00040382 [Ensete ventricosum]|nr:hypothetical protein BHM03_00040382 [Ensete ventricosum]
MLFLNSSSGSSSDISVTNGPTTLHNKRKISYVSLGPLKDTERKDLNCAVKEYLLFAGYRLTAMTFLEEVSSNWRYNEHEKAGRSKVQNLKQSMDLQRKQLNDCRAEITALKMHIEGARASRSWTSGESESTKAPYTDKSKEEKKTSYGELEDLKGVDSTTRNQEPIIALSKDVQSEEKVVEINEVAVVSKSVDLVSTNSDENHGYQVSKDVRSRPDNIVSCNDSVEYQENVHKLISVLKSEDKGLNQNSESPKREKTQKMVKYLKTCYF